MCYLRRYDVLRGYPARPYDLLVLLHRTTIGEWCITCALVYDERDLVPSLAEQLQLAFPSISPLCRSLIVALTDRRGRIRSADSFARVLGLQSRHQLARLLRRDGLPQIEELAGWITVLGLLRDQDSGVRSLYRFALQLDQCPPTMYRAVKRITGKTWRVVKAEG